jgi:glycosyltransferase involved in cell wall biosynthesis
MKVLHIIDSLGLGGAQTVVKGIFEAQKDNSDIYLYALRTRTITTQIDHPHVLIYPSESKYSLGPLFAMRRLIQKEGITILHCHLFRANVFGWLLKIIWFPKSKLIMHEHGSIALDGAAYKSQLKVSKRAVTAYIAVSNAMKVELAKINLDQNKVFVIHNFVDLNKFDRKNISWDIQEERKKLGIPENAFVIGFAGRLSEEKGWKEFLEAGKAAAQELENLYLLVAGDGKDKEAFLKHIKNLNLSNKVAYLGYIDNMVGFYSLIDCLIIPSTKESFGLSALEAQSMRVPIIVSAIDGLKEIVTGQRGLEFESRDSNDLANKILLLHRDLALQSKIVAEADKTIQKYAAKPYIQSLNTLYAYEA